MATTSKEKGSMWLVGVVILAILVVSGFLVLRPGPEKPKDESGGNKPAASRTVTKTVYVENPEPRFIRGITPLKLSVDYEFNIESDSSVRITYPDGQSAVYVPHKGCQQFPVPRFSGPKTFTDPNDPSGHREFRIYRLRSGEGTCR